MDVKEAAKLAKEYVADLFKDEGISNVGLGPVHTKGSGHVIIHVWNLHKLITNSLNRTYPCSVAM